MSIICLYVRNIGSQGTLVSEMTREEATDIVKKFKDTDYQVGILSAKDLKSLSKVYGEFAPFKEVDNMYIVDILEKKIQDKILDKEKRTSLFDLANKIVNKNGITSVNFDKAVSIDELEILSKIPYSHIAKIGRVDKIKGKSSEARNKKVINLRKLYNTEDISNITDMNVACRKQLKLNGCEYALASWLKEGELKAKNINTKIFNLEKLKLSIDKIKELTLKTQDEFHTELVELLAQCGIALVLVEKFPNTNVIGATQWINEGKQAIIQLTLKGKRADSFWFTLMHEIAHIVEHDSKDFHMQDEDKLILEDEADNIARNWLIPDDEYMKFKLKGHTSITSIIDFSKSMKIHPCILIGRLQHDGVLSWSTYSGYKPKIKII
ncbi:ImmA/IrrE family metallo-endopeptidase [Romboutsia sp.]|uniref:ImmA/IrrE family metallo-endopeptidase n=1 Tax=Romboutsia sp. TaxID=1965302 RepID=UPI003F2AE051